MVNLMHDDDAWMDDAVSCTALCCVGLGRERVRVRPTDRAARSL